MKRITLVQMKAGEKGTIAQVDGGSRLEKRLDAMGVRVNTGIIKLSAFVMRGPVAIKAGRTVIAVGYGMASKIWVDVAKK